MLVIEGISDASVTLTNYDATTPEGKKIIVLSTELDGPVFDPDKGVTKQLYFDNVGQKTFTLGLSVRGMAWYGDYDILLQSCAEPTLGDLTGDCRVDLTDFAAFASDWRRSDLPGIEHMPAAHWRLDETEGNLAHDSTVGYDATLHGDPAWQPWAGVTAGALQFDGVDDYLSAPFVLNPAAGPFSIFGWVKGNTPGRAIISQASASTWLCTDPSNGWLVTELKGPGWGAGVLASQTAITDGRWHHVGLVWDPPERTLYVDGAEVARDTQADVGSSEGGLYIGAGENLQSGSFWSGMLDDVRLYDHFVVPNDVLQSPESIKSDYDGNGRIDSTDLRVLGSEWLNCYLLFRELCWEQ